MAIYNAKKQSWGSCTNNSRGIVLCNLANEKHFNIPSTPGPTYWPTLPKKSLGILNIFATKIPSNLHCSTNNILDLNSDRSSILFTISANPLAPLLNTQNYSDRKKCYDIVNEYINLKIKLIFNLGIDEAIKNITTLVQRATWTSTLFIKSNNSDKSHNSNSNCLVPEEVQCFHC